MRIRIRTLNQNYFSPPTFIFDCVSVIGSPFTSVTHKAYKDICFIICFRVHIRLIYSPLLKFLYAKLLNSRRRGTKNVQGYSRGFNYKFIKKKNVPGSHRKQQNRNVCGEGNVNYEKERKRICIIRFSVHGEILKSSVTVIF